MSLIKIICAAMFACIAPVLAQAQKALVEGTVAYKAVLNKPDGSSKEGTYIISLKNKQVRKELNIGNDFRNVTILDNTEKGFILRSIAEKNLAVEITSDDFKKRNEKYEGAVVKELSEKKTIAGIEAQKAVITYKDGSSANVYYTTQWMPDLPATFERFKGINGFPLAFDYKNDQGTITFEVVKLDENVVEDSKFKVPANYKVISNEEYRQLKAK